MSGAAQRPRILVARTDGAAGLVCTLPLLRGLRAAHPAAWIGVLTGAELGPLVARHPDANEAIAFPSGGGIVARLRLERALRGRGLDDAILADAVPPGWLGGLARRAGASRVVGGEGAEGAESDTRRHETDRVLALGAGFGVAGQVVPGRLFPDSGEVMHVRAGLAARSRDLQRPIVAVHIGRAGDAERWPAERYAALMRRRYEHDGSGFVLLWTPGGSAEDAPEGHDLMAREIHTRLVGVPCLRWPAATMAALVAALAECDTVITPMTDVPHLAAAVGRPVVALCGAVNVQRWRPVGVPYELARAPGGALADVTVDHAFAACEVLATRVSMLGAG